jgi:hypothetical protein
VALLRDWFVGDDDVDDWPDTETQAYFDDLGLDRESEDAQAESEVLSQCRICGQVHGDDCADYGWFLASCYPGVE